MAKMLMRIKKLDKNAKTPVHSSEEAAGFDLHALHDVVVEPKSTTIIPTGICLEIPSGYYVKLAGRSGLATKGITPLGGVIDSDYRGEIKVILHNLSAEPHKVNSGDRVAQGVLIPIVQAAFEEADELSETKRNDKGLGSSGR